jgi:hypothetical protein
MPGNFVNCFEYEAGPCARKRNLVICGTNRHELGSLIGRFEGRGLGLVGVNVLPQGWRLRRQSSALSCWCPASKLALRRLTVRSHERGTATARGTQQAGVASTGCCDAANGAFGLLVASGGKHAAPGIGTGVSRARGVAGSRCRGGPQGARPNRTWLWA